METQRRGIGRCPPKKGTQIVLESDAVVHVQSTRGRRLPWLPAVGRVLGRRATVVKSVGSGFKSRGVYGATVG
jgi:hypothetical protein